ncbi:MAG: zinc-dependent metalloprotease [Bacteroidetes bacterium]|nr:zinc-dependent metalloprotease [Bacteroidota bacterium]
MKKHFFTVLVGFMLFGFQANSQNYWKATKETDVSKGKDIFAGHYKPNAYLIYKLDETIIKSDLAKAPTGKISTSPVTIMVPIGDGTVEKFRVVEASVMEPALAAKFPQIKSYAGRGIDHPSSTIRFDVTPEGFHAMILSPDRSTIYVNPLSVDNNSRVYAIYNRANTSSPIEFKCEMPDDVLTNGAGKATTIKGNADDGTLRTYRLALCVTGEFSQYFLGGVVGTDDEKKAIVLAQVTTDLTRANGIYERDFGITMQFVEKELSIIYLDPTTDPFTNNFNSKTQQVCDDSIGNANYDIGHVVHKAGDNGNAGCIACVCKTGSKGSGFTMYSHPDLLDPFVVDYWTHEMGHQYGANHTFTFNNEGTGANVEPGSGSTIMGYAGITGGTDVQPHSDDYFHAVSIGQVSNYFRTGQGGCAVKTITGNTAPTADAGSDYTIPKSTPFMLTGVSTDVDVTDVPSYEWEQIDVYESGGSNTYPQQGSTKGPVFRSILYSAQPTRVFPNLTTILSGALYNKWEALPAVARDLNFRFTVRDNHPLGGNNMSDDMIVTVTTSSGPFQITAPNTTGISWDAGTMQSVTWDVANTTSAPVSCSQVNILLSVDGGQTFPIVLASNTPNDGSQDVLVPNYDVTNARIKVESVGNIFFDINNKDITIKGSLPVTWLSFTAEKSGANTVLLNWSTANELNNDHFEVERSNDGSNFAMITSIKAGSNPNQVQQYAYTDKAAMQGDNYYRIKQVDLDGRFTYSDIKKVTIDGISTFFSIRPNPAVNKASLIASTRLNNVLISLVSTTGKIVYSTTQPLVNAGDIITIPVNNLAKGVYMIKITSDEGNKTQKLVVQ